MELWVVTLWSSYGRIAKAVKTGIFSKKKSISRLALFLAVILMFFETTTKNVYAGKADHQYGDAYGAKNNDEEFYVWSRVSDTKQPLYAYLNDYNEHKSEYESGDRTFRVMLVQHIDRTSGASSIGGVEGHRMGWASTMYSYDMYAYYQADWTRIDYGSANHTGDSLVAVSKNPQIDVTRSNGGINGLLFTRGSQRTFICKNAKANNNYYFYFPDESDRKPQYQLWFGHTFWTSNLYAFDDAGNSWGKNSSNSKKEVKDSLSGKVRDTWEVVQGRNGTMHIQTDYEYRLGVMDSYGLVVDKWSFSRDYDSWYIYVGTPCDPGTMDNVIGSENSLTLGNGSSKTIDKPAYIKKNGTLTISEGAVLYVDNLLILNGKIENHGIIVVNPGGAICQWDKGLGILDCSGSGTNNSGGDVIVREHGQVMVNEFKGNLGHIVLKGNLSANKMEIYNCVIDYNGSKDRLKGASGLKNNMHMMRAVDNKTKKFVLDFLGADIQKNGSGEKKELKNNIEH